MKEPYLEVGDIVVRTGFVNSRSSFARDFLGCFTEGKLYEVIDTRDVSAIILDDNGRRRFISLYHVYNPDGELIWTKVGNTNAEAVAVLRKEDDDV